MISRRPMWMLLFSCALVSSGLYTTAAVAAGERGAVQGGELSQEWLVSQAAEASDDESSETAPAEASEEAFERPTLSLGSSGPLVIQIQVLLQKQSLYGGPINGDFNAETVEAVKAFQTEKGLEPTGSVDEATWGPLTGEAAEMAEAAEPQVSEEEASAGETSQAEAAASGSNARLIMAAIALLGLGAGGFGLWRILAVPVPQPLDYSDVEEEEGYADEGYADDDYADDSEQSQSMSPSSSAITTATALAAQSASGGAASQLSVESSGEISGLRVSQDESVGLVQREAAAVGLGGERHIKGLSEEDLFLPDGGLAEVSAGDAHGRKQTAAEHKKVLQRQPKQASFTDTAVAIATQSARAAAHSQAMAQGKSATGKSPVLDKSSESSASEQGRLKNARAGRGSRGRSNLAKSDRSKAALDRANHLSSSPPPPPPAPSEIIQATPAGALEQPELVTNPLMERVDIVDMLITDLQGADPAKRRKAIWELGQRCDSRAIQPLVNMMGNSDSRQRSLILAALSEIGTQTLKPMKQALALSLQDENAEVRKNAIRDLTRIYDLVAEISHLLHSALDDPDPEVQDTARWALKQLNRIRSNAQLEGSPPDQPVLQQSVSPPESLSGEDSLKYRSSAEQS